MKIQCTACDCNEARVLCCEDEAALCWTCDAKVHAANKLASSHQRVPLNSSSSQMPKCDICQEGTGYFFCLEDRALLCRRCDTAIHDANNLKSRHQKFLLTGVKVGLEPHDAGPSSSSKNPKGEGRKSCPRKTIVTPSAQPLPILSFPSHASGYSDVAPLSAASASTAEWEVEDFTRFPEFSDFTYILPDNETSKGDSGKHGDSEGSGMMRSSGEEEISECLGVIPESSFIIPLMQPQSTGSGLFWPTMFQSQREAFSELPMMNRDWHNGGQDARKKRRSAT